MPSMCSWDTEGSSKDAVTGFTIFEVYINSLDDTTGFTIIFEADDGICSTATYSGFGFKYTSCTNGGWLS